MRKKLHFSTLGKALLAFTATMAFSLSASAVAPAGYQPAKAPEGSSFTLSSLEDSLTPAFKEAGTQITLGNLSTDASKMTQGYKTVYFSKDGKLPSSEALAKYQENFSKFTGDSVFFGSFVNYFTLGEQGDAGFNGIGVNQGLRNQFFFDNKYTVAPNANLNEHLLLGSEDKHHGKEVTALAGERSKVLVLEKAYSNFLSRDENRLEVETYTPQKDLGTEETAEPITHADYVLQNLLGKWNHELEGFASNNLTSENNYNGLLSEGGAVKVLTFYTGKAKVNNFNHFDLFYQLNEPASQNEAPTYKGLTPQFAKILDEGYKVVNLSLSGEFPRGEIKEIIEQGHKQNQISEDKYNEALDYFNLKTQDGFFKAMKVAFDGQFPGQPGLLEALRDAGKKDAVIVQANGNDLRNLPFATYELERNKDNAEFNKIKNFYITVTSRDKASTPCGLAKFYCITGPDHASGITNGNGDQTPNEWKSAGGTSFATPYVAGTVAMVRQVFPFMTNEDLQLTVLSTATPLQGEENKWKDEKDREDYDYPSRVANEPEATDGKARPYDASFKRGYGYFDKRVTDRYGWGMVNPVAAARGPGDIPEGRYLNYDLTKNNASPSADQVWTFSNFIYGDTRLALSTSQPADKTPLLNIQGPLAINDVVVGKNARLNLDGVLPDSTQTSGMMPVQVNDGAVLSGAGFMGTPILKAGSLLVARSLTNHDRAIAYSDSFAKSTLGATDVADAMTKSPEFKKFIANLPSADSVFVEEGSALMLDLNYPLLLNNKFVEFETKSDLLTDAQKQELREKPYRVWEKPTLILRPGKTAKAENGTYTGIGIISNNKSLFLNNPNIRAVNSLFAVKANEELDGVAYHTYNFNSDKFGKAAPDLETAGRVITCADGKDDEALHAQCNTLDALKAHEAKTDDATIREKGGFNGNLYLFSLKLKDAEEVIDDVAHDNKPQGAKTKARGADLEYDDAVKFGGKNVKTILKQHNPSTQLAEKILNGDDALLVNTSHAVSGAEYNQFRQRALISATFSADRAFFSLARTPRNEKSGYNLSYKGSLADGRANDYSNANQLQVSYWSPERKWNAGFILSQNRFQAATTEVESTFFGKGVFFNLEQRMDIAPQSGLGNVLDHVSWNLGFNYNNFSGALNRKGNLAGREFNFAQDYSANVFTAGAMLALPFSNAQQNFFFKPYLGLGFNYTQTPEVKESFAPYELTYNEYSSSSFSPKLGFFSKVIFKDWDFFVDYALNWTSGEQASGKLVDKSDDTSYNFQYSSVNRTLAHYSEFGVHKAIKDWDFEVYGQASYKNYFSKGLGVKVTYKF